MIKISVSMLSVLVMLSGCLTPLVLVGSAIGGAVQVDQVSEVKNLKIRIRKLEDDISRR